MIRKYSNELVQAREEIGRLQGILALEAKAGSSAKHDMERRHMELLTVLRDLEARLRTAERRSRRDTDEIKRLTAKMDEERSTTRAAYQEQREKVQDLLGQRNNLKAQVERLTKPEPSLDVFDNSVDQVSESYIKSHGQPSLDGLNYAIDNLIQNALTDVEHFIRLHQQDETVENSMDCDLFGVHQNHPLLVALASQDFADDYLGLLLDAFLHHAICCELHALFFSGRVATFRRPGRADLLEDLFDRIVSNGT